MKAVRGLLRDLIERRLWPVAVLLLAAAVAVPVYLGRSSAEDAATPPATQHADLAKGSKAAVSLEDAATADDRRGSVRNPFKQLHVPKAATPGTGDATPTSDAAAKPTTPSSGNGSGDGSTPPSTGGGSDGSGGSKGSGGGSSNTDPLDTYHLTLRFGHADAEQLKTYDDVARLSPLPTADNPFFVYTGVLNDGKTAVFLLSSDATATGDGHCKPSAKSCETIEVKQGDTEFFDMTLGGQPIQYQLDVVRIFRKGTSSTTAAAAANERHSNAGAAMLRDAHVKGASTFKGAASYRWLPDRGVLVPASQHLKAHASASGGAAASSADAAAALPGQPVWHWRFGA
jgi:hypothetical protein